MMEILNSDVYLNGGSCIELSDFAFDSLSKCYTEHGFCEEILISLENWKCMYRVFMSRLGDLFTKKGIEQVID